MFLLDNLVRYKIRFLVAFKDGTISPRVFRLNDIMTVSQRELTRLQQSGAKIEVLEKVVPNPKKQKVEDEA